MHIMANRGSADNMITYNHICDTMEDLAAIDPSEINLGTTALVIEGSTGGIEVYIAKSTKEWVLM